MPAARVKQAVFDRAQTRAVGVFRRGRCAHQQEHYERGDESRGVKHVADRRPELRHDHACE
jgi:hypothetical protein